MYYHGSRALMIYAFLFAVLQWQTACTRLSIHSPAEITIRIAMARTEPRQPRNAVGTSFQQNTRQQKEKQV
jgi:uncharacterized protein involved in tellurium resistance